MHATTETAVQLNDLSTPERFAADHSHILTAKALRWQLRNRHNNGLAEAGACVSLGRKLLIRKSAYERWLATQIEVAA